MNVELFTSKEFEILTPGIDNKKVKTALENVYQAANIYERFDALCELIECCEEFSENNNVNAHICHLQKNANEFAKVIVNAKASEDLAAKRKLRKKYKIIDPAYMPWPIPATKLDITKFSDRKSYVKAARLHNFITYAKEKYREVNKSDVAYDKQYNVKYLTDSEREPYRIFISQGKLKQITLDLNTQRLVLKDFETKGYTAHRKNDKAIFIISPRGEIFVGSTIPYAFYHSSFLAGRPILFAGRMRAEDGYLLRVRDYSGHYMPRFEHGRQMLAFFRKNDLLSHPFEFKLKASSYYANEKFQLQSIANLEKQLNIWPSMKLIYQQALQCGWNKEQAFKEVINFKVQIGKEINKTPQMIEAVIYQFKIATLIRLHADSFKKQIGISNNTVIEDFKSLAKFYIENNLSTADDDGFIIKEISNAKRLIATKIQFRESFLNEIQQLESLPGTKDLVIEAGVTNTIKDLIDEMTTLDKDTCFEHLQKSGNQLFERATALRHFLVERNKKNEFISAKNELMQLLSSEMNYMSADARKSGEAVFAKLQCACELKDVINAALKILNHPDLIKRSGLVSSLFQNPIKAKLNEFLKHCYRLDALEDVQKHLNKNTLSRNN